MTKKTSLLDFPCTFPIKVVGYNNDELLDTVITIIKSQFPEITAEQLLTRPSRDKKYLAITITVTAHNQQQLDAVYQSLSISEKIIMAL